MKKINLIFILGILILTGIITAGCKSMQIESLESISGPAQVRQGMDINPRDITVYAIYRDGSRKVVNISAGNITFNKHTPGPQTVRVRVQNQEMNFQTEVMALRSISITSQPRTVIFKEGEEINRSWPGLEIRGEWDQLGSAVIPISECEVTGYSKDRTGRQTVQVSFEGHRVSFNIEVRAMTAIQIVQPPSRTDYLQGQSLDLSGLRVVGIWEGFPPEELRITASDVTGFNSNNAGIQRLRVTKNGHSAYFSVEVLVLSRIEMERPPRRDYLVGESFDFAGILVYGIYTGSDPGKMRREQIPASQLTVTGFNSSHVVNDQRVRIGIGNITVDFFVNITSFVPAPDPMPASPPVTTPSTPPSNLPGTVATVPSTPPSTPVATLPSAPPQVTPVPLPAPLPTTPSTQTFTSIDDAAAYLNGLPSNNANNPYPLNVGVNLIAMSGNNSTWRNLLDAIGEAGKYVNLNLSACTMSGSTIFDPANNISNGKNRIVSIVFPNVATTIQNTPANAPGFRYFTSLRSVTFGSSMASIPDYAFTGLTSLTIVTFQRANISIGSNDSFPEGAALQPAYAAGGAGTYIRSGNTWTKQ